jgi:hypothetical protein
MSIHLCPSLKNQLGRGIFLPQEEARLLAEGYIFACKLTSNTGIKGSLVCRRPIADAVTDAELDNPVSKHPLIRVYTQSSSLPR